MFIRLKDRTGASILEYSLILGLVSIMFISMNTYVKRGVQGRMKDLTDHFIGSEQVGEVNPTAVSNSGPITGGNPVTEGPITDPVTGEEITALAPTSAVTTSSTLTDNIGGGRSLSLEETTLMRSQSTVIDDGRYK